ncbi:MAG: hypothetical protein HYY11_03095 [Candidatus Methylomirabilis oxyfera]|nr:hypothetical protein [Candidatus Methylomirabilis oxyfera]
MSGLLHAAVVSPLENTGDTVRRLCRRARPSMSVVLHRSLHSNRSIDGGLEIVVASATASLYINDELRGS